MWFERGVLRSQRPSSAGGNGNGRIVVLVRGGCNSRGPESTIQQRQHNHRREQSSRNLQHVETSRYGELQAGVVMRHISATSSPRLEHVEFATCDNT